MAEDVLPVFSFRSFNTASYVYGEKVCSNFIDLHAAVQLSQNHLLKRLLFLWCACLSPLLQVNWPSMCGFTSRLSVLSH